MGGAARVLESTVDYVKVREQFGRPIGSFQAVKHKLADMLVELESARSAAYYAVSAVESGSPDLPLAASIAKAYCSTAYYHIAAESIQLHGGIGFTWEHPAHLYFKRAKGSETLLGSPAYHRELIAQRLGCRPSACSADLSQGAASMVMVLTWVCSSTASAPMVRPNPLLL